jgi:hypothetical protein
VPTPRKEVDWASALDFDAALISLHYELQGDWYRDPWGWPELDWLVADDRDLLVARLNSTGVRKVAKVDVPKENFGTRPAIVMDVVDRLAYQALVDRHSVKLIGDLRPWVFGWRLVDENPSPGEWSHNDRQHAAFRDVISQAAAFSTAALRTDVVSCFKSIDLERLCEMVVTRCSTSRMTDRLTSFVFGWGTVAGRGGLAQRSAASAALANMYLSPVDDVLHAHDRRSRKPRGKPRGLFRTLGSVPRVARWMDDIWVFGHDAGRLRVVQLEIQDALRSIGLEMNHAKTDLLEGSAVEYEVKHVQHSAIEGALLGDDSDTLPLLELVAQLLDNPAKADRTSVKFATRRMREHEVFGPVDRFIEHAPEMPHAADALARLFRDADRWRDLPEWYVEYAKSPWGVVKWGVAQLGTAFPSKVSSRSDTRRLEVVASYFLDVLKGDPPLPLLALAAQRLAAWNKDDAKAAFRQAATASGDPQSRRVLALAANHAGEDRAVVRAMLSEFEENQITLRMLKGRSYRIPVKADFDGM